MSYDCSTAGELYIDDQLITEMEIDGQAVDFLEIDGQCVWAALLPGQIIFDVPGNYEWTIPAPLQEVELCMVGAGGSGSAECECGTTDGGGGGGYAGTEISQTEQVTPGEVVTVVVGAGGSGVPCISSCDGANGNSGMDSVFGSVTAPGGAGGNQEWSGYLGNGGQGPDGCGGGGYTDGIRHSTSGRGFGGQASSFGDGGDYGSNPGGTGAGGGGVYGGGTSGAGGRGEVRASWGGYTPETRSDRTFKISEMTVETMNRLKIRRVS